MNKRLKVSTEVGELLSRNEVPCCVKRCNFIFLHLNSIRKDNYNIMSQKCIEPHLVSVVRLILRTVDDLLTSGDRTNQTPDLQYYNIQCCQIGTDFPPTLATRFMFLMLSCGRVCPAWRNKRGGAGGSANKTIKHRAVEMFLCSVFICNVLYSFPVLDMKRGIRFILIKYFFFLLK